MLLSFSQGRGGRRQKEIKEQLRKSHRSEQTIKKGGKGECQLLRGHQFKMVSGQGKWQEWMPKLERSRSDLRKPCYPQRAGIPASEEHGSGSHPDNVWFRQDGRAPLRGGFSEPPKPQGTWEDRGRESIDHSRSCLLFAVKHAAREVPINSRV